MKEVEQNQADNSLTIEHQPVSTFSKSLVRSFFALILGFITYAYCIGWMHHGASIFTSNAHKEYWGLFVLGERYFIRLLLDLLAYYAAGFIVALTSRKESYLLAFFSVLPFVLIKGYLILAGFYYTFDPLTEEYVGISIGNKIFSCISFVTCPLLLLIAVEHGSKLSVSYGSFFDSRKNSLFGIKWFNYIWLFFIAGPLLSQLTIHADYSLKIIKFNYDLLYLGRIGVFGLIAMGLGILPTYVMGYVLFQSYIYLSNYDNKLNTLKRIGYVMFFMLICPILIVIISIPIEYVIQHFLSRYYYY